ncbi:MAG TPA: DUF484 domain-containing protein [Methylophilaceae bacterium]|nr:DUF484 domain-containing protein [Methylophilaceae bacterium]HAJ72283.1 DUF484 domain-containing protein [Methylophilaceae bacterium]
MEEEIKAYLKAHPEFFERHAYLLTELYLPSPHGDGAISLAQRQQLAQRDKIRVLESKFTELILNAEENDKTSEKIHRLTIGLLGAPSFDALNKHLTEFLSGQFDLPDSQLKIWSSSSLLADQISAFVVAEESLINWARDLSQPYCGPMPNVDIASWFTEAPASIAIVPLKGKDTFGLLLLPSQDKNHFYAGMGTVFLNRIGDLVSASLLRYIN